MAISMGADHASRHVLLDRTVEALAARALGIAPSEAARAFYRTSLPALAHAALVARRADPPGLSPTTAPGRLVELAMTTSDFPRLVGDLLRRVLIAPYATARPTFREFSTEVPIPTFQNLDLVSPGEAPRPQPLGEAGEVAGGSASERRETLTPTTHSVRLPISFQLLVNDDLGGIAALLAGARENLLSFENEQALALFTANAGLGVTLADGNEWFHASRSNVATSGSLDLAKLGELRALVKNQSSSSGAKLNGDADLILCSPASQTLAESLAASLAPAARIRVLGDGNLGGTRVYALSSQNPPLVHGYVGGSGPEVVTAASWASLGLEARLSLHFGVGVARPIGAATAAGA